MSIIELTSNQYYKGLNNRYDKRVTSLLKDGFILNREYMCWHKGKFSFNSFNNSRYITNQSVMIADKRYFKDMLERYL